MKKVKTTERYTPSVKGGDKNEKGKNNRALYTICQTVGAGEEYGF
jgi:hypothetical protein